MVFKILLSHSVGGRPCGNLFPCFTGSLQRTEDHKDRLFGIEKAFILPTPFFFFFLFLLSAKSFYLFLPILLYLSAFFFKKTVISGYSLYLCCVTCPVSRKETYIYISPYADIEITDESKRSH
jgi:hypothetical protein